MGMQRTAYRAKKDPFKYFSLWEAVQEGLSK
jgi:hypothetical protein